MGKKTYHIFFSKLSSPLRIDIISKLEKKSMSVGRLGKELGVEQSKLSHALKELRDCNIVNATQKGKQRVYSLSKTLKPILRLIDCHSKTCSKCRSCRK